MKKNFRGLFFAIAFAIAACTTNNSKNDANASDSSAAVEQGIANNQQNNSVYDPDPSDTIPATAYGINTYGKETEELLRAKLQAMNKEDIDNNIIDSFSRRFIFFQYDLNDDGSKEIFVGLLGPYFCGSGGCTILLLNNEGDLITRFTVTDYPVIIADTKTNGWKDLILMSGNKNHLIKFNGKVYPSNPSVQPVFIITPGDSLPRALNFSNEPYAWFKF